MVRAAAGGDEGDEGYRGHLCSQAADICEDLWSVLSGGSAHQQALYLSSLNPTLLALAHAAPTVCAAACCLPATQCLSCFMPLLSLRVLWFAYRMLLVIVCVYVARTSTAAPASVTASYNMCVGAPCL